MAPAPDLFDPYTSAGDVLGWMRGGAISPAAVMDAVLDRIAALNPALNAIVSLGDRDALMAQAAAADPALPLGGLPLAIKDLHDTAGIRTTLGSPLYADHVPDADAVLVTRLKAAGAIVIGKTNVPEFGLGSHTFNPVFGATVNPYAPARTIGGSSGGAAAALAAGMVWMADGSDAMGSLRNPAAFGNVYGFRPTWGRVPDDPASGDLYLKRLSTDGPMARNVADIARMLAVLAQPDPRWPGAPWPAQDFLAGLDRDIAGTRVAWAGDWSGAYTFEDGILDMCGTGLDVLAGQGADVSEIAAPFPAEDLWQSWTDQRAFFNAVSHADHMRTQAGRDALKPEILWEVEKGRALSAADLHTASLLRSNWLRAAQELFQKFDALILPSAQVFPFEVGMRYPTRIAGRTMDTYHRWMEVMIPASLLGLPAISVPLGFGAPGTPTAGLPMGMQIIGPPGADARVLQIAQAYHRATLWPQRCPPAVAD